MMNDKPTVMLLFSNPHPHSVEQGMFLSPNTKGKPNAFWSFMEEAGWFELSTNEPHDLKRKFLTNDHNGQFNFIFYCYYVFPTKFPDQIEKIFSQDQWNIIKNKSLKNFMKFVDNIHVDSILIFNKDIFNSIATNHVSKYIETLDNGNLVIDKLKDHCIHVPVYLTYPTGWHFSRNITTLRRGNLKRIKKEIISSVEKVEITEPSIIFRINNFYRPDMKPIELYDATRGRWVIGTDRKKAELAFSVYKGIVKEVYKIEAWFPAGATFSTRADAPPKGRWEFVGNVAEKRTRDKYLNKSVAHYFPTGGSNPIRYINIKNG